MTSRQAGRRLAAIHSARKPKNSGGRRQKETPLRPKERRQLLQLVVCGCAFVLLVTAKLLLPGRMTQINARLSDALRRNMDVQSVFSAVGRAFAGEEGMASEVYQAVFHPQTDTPMTTVSVPQAAARSALELLRRSLPEETSSQEDQTTPEETASGTADGETASALDYVLYSGQNLPDGVSMEQVILDFDYCTPVAGTLSSTFGYREHPIEGEERFHYGVDLAAATGTAIGCFADGTVTAVGQSSSYGNYCTVAHSGGYTTLYAHCDRVTVSAGTEVTEGQKIAEVGETGMATGPHLHFELQQEGTYLNPIYYVSTV